MKKTLAVILSLLLILTLTAACVTGNSGGSSDSSRSSSRDRDSRDRDSDRESSRDRDRDNEGSDKGGDGDRGTGGTTPTPPRGGSPGDTPGGGTPGRDLGYADAIIGRWVTDFDIGEMIRDELGSEFRDLNVDFVIEMIFEFSPDGSSILSVDERSMLRNMDIFIEQLIDYLMVMTAIEMGMTPEELDLLFLEAYGMTFEEMINEELKDELDMNVLLEDMQASGTGTYEVISDRLFFAEEGDPLDYDDYVVITISGNTMTFLEASIDDGSLPLPMVFRRAR